MKTIPYSHQSIDAGDIKEVVKVLKSDWLTQGPKVREFEDGLCKYTGARYAVAVSSGTAALHIACLAGGISPGDEVITSPITFLASSNCVIYCGGKPVFADIRSDTANIDPEEIRRRITKKTKAIIPVHFAGHPAEVTTIHLLGKKRNLLIIEDASHALGAEYKSNGRWLRIGSCRHSDMAIFSFHPVKSITTGEGGAILTNRKDLYEKSLFLRNHGVTKEKRRFHGAAGMIKAAGPWYYEMQTLGFNYRITDIQCALGVSQLKKIQSFVMERRRIAQFYNSLLSNIEEIELPVELAGYQSARHLYPIRLKNGKRRKALFEFLREGGIGVQVHYIPVYLQPYYQSRFEYKKGECPLAEQYYECTISLPLYSQIRKKDIKKVVRLIREYIYAKHK